MTRQVRGRRHVLGGDLQTFASSSLCPFWEESEAFNDAVAAFAAELR